MQEPHLIIIPSVSVWRDGNTFIFDRKFYDGVLLYTKMWPGKVSCIMSVSRSFLPMFGSVKVKNGELPFGCIVLDGHEQIGIQHLNGASVVLAAADSHIQLHISKLCRKLKIRCVYIIENIPETRYQIVSLETKNPLIKLRRYFYIWNGERKRLAAFSLADGLQVNGTAAFSEYNKTGNNLLYFDTRVNKSLIIGDKDLEQRLQYLPENKPLRLAFSGRLIRMKGADQLVKLAKMVRERNIQFRLTIYGSGDLDDEMKEYIHGNQLADMVSMPGSVDFYSELIPQLKQNVDLFICLHRQSDPSCTYLETLSCGVPIIGYNNKAFSGLLEQSDIGWKAEINSLNDVADIIESINMNRDRIAEKSRNAVRFARLHDFETTFQNRINHLLHFVQQDVQT